MNGLSQWDDRRLIEQAQRGNAVAFAELYRRYYRRIHQTIYRLLRHRDDAEDIVQNTFLNAWRSLGNFKGESEFFTWLYRIAVNLAISHQRRRSSGREKPLYEGDEQQRGYEPPAHAPHPATGLETQEDLEHLRHAMQGLSEDHRIIICLKDLEDMSYEEISRVLHIPIGTVRSRLHRARLELAQLLGLLTPTVETTNGVHQRS
ncbi:MAG: sigma-70 family RNA polymerase sigma factor, partial [Gemmataceae bacterium]|nr:sigma-70 family RNA polymerase sigma factor [Gemmataceae bacterium]